MVRRAVGFALVLAALAGTAAGQTSRLAILEAEDRRAPTPRDLAVLRGGLHSGDPETVRIAVRALGRLERPALVADIAPLLRHSMPEVRAEAANALGQSLQGLKREATRASAVRRTNGGSGADRARQNSGEPRRSAAEAEGQAGVDGVISLLSARLNVEAESSVRSAICETLGRIAVTPDQTSRVETTIVSALARDGSNGGRLGVAKGLAALTAQHRSSTFADQTIDALRTLAHFPERDKTDPARDARVRRLALEALTSARRVDDRTLVEASHDPDAQVRRLAMRAAAEAKEPLPAAAEVRDRGIADSVAMVRLEALRAEAAASGAGACAVSVAAVKDRDVGVVLVALDQLSVCGSQPDAVAVLQQTVDDQSLASAPRGWHRAAHALVALAAASPEAAAAALPHFTGSSVWQLRMYAARAATTLKDRAVLETLAADASDNVVEAAIDGLVKVAGHDRDPAYVKALSRSGYQAIRAAARALDGSTASAGVPEALNAALDRLKAEGRDNSHDARDAIEQTLGSGSAPARRSSPGSRASEGGKASAERSENDLNADDLRRLASPRARITIRGLGTVELALFTSEAPATVLRFAKLAQSGYYNGLTFHRVVANFVIQGGSPGSNEYVGDAMFMRDELGLWPHVRGAVGISTRGRDTGDAQIFVDLVDNPRLDHDYTVFAQVLNGMDVVDRILEGDVIDKIEILVN
jgi:cyclophilin family peptidyl-prolyl cis-trans isomerase